MTTRWICKPEFMALAQHLKERGSVPPTTTLVQSDKLNAHIVLSEGNQSLGLFLQSADATLSPEAFSRFCSGWRTDRGIALFTEEQWGSTKRDKDSTNPGDVFLLQCQVFCAFLHLVPLSARTHGQTVCPVVLIDPREA